MLRITDQTNDPGFATLRVVVDRFPQLREMSKTANLDPSEFNNLPDSAFAWPGRRQFPVHNEAHAALSVGYSKLAAVVPSDVQAFLEKAAALYDIDLGDFETPTVKIAEDPSEEFLLREKKRFRVKSAADVQVAERVYLEKYATLTIEDRAEAGFNLVKMAEHFQYQLHPSTHKLAGFTITSTRVLKDWVEARKEASTKLGSSLVNAFEALAKQFQNVEPYITNRGDQVKLAQLISDLDQRAGLTPYYGKKLPDPIQTVFNTDKLPRNFMKVGSALQNTALLQSLPLSFWEDTLGPDIAKEIAPTGTVDMTMLAQILPTLPADLKAALETQLAAYSK